MNENGAVMTAIVRVTSHTTTPEVHVIGNYVTTVAITRAKPGQQPEQICLEAMLVSSELEWIHRKACPSCWSVLVSGAS